MRISIAIIALLVFGCKTEKKQEISNPEIELNVIQKIAKAHGFDNWKKVNEISFSFNVDRDTSHFERTWIWEPKTNKITAISMKDTLVYNRKSMDSIAQKTNGGFVNDRYWLLTPFNLMWDEKNYTHKHVANDTAPISKKTMQKLTIVYANEGGYTPGDAYDFYFEDDYIIKEWVFRKSNNSEPSLTTTWEDYIEIKGLKLPQMHKKEAGDFKLYFTNINVK